MQLPKKNEISVGGNYLTAGRYETTITNLRNFKYNNGNAGVEFVLTGPGGAVTKKGFSLVKTGPLASFAYAAGYPEEENATFEPHKLLNRRVSVEVVKQGDFHDVLDFSWQPVNGEPRASKAPQPAPPVAAPDEGDQNDLPF